MENNTWFKVVGFFTIVGAIAALLVVPEVRKFLRLDSGVSPQPTPSAVPSKVGEYIPSATPVPPSPTPSISQSEPSILPKALAQTSGESHGSSFTNNSDQSSEIRSGYFIIGLCSRDRAIALQESQRENARGLYTHVVNSSDWSNLVSGWYIIVYGIYDSKSDAIIAQKEMESRGVKSYVKHSGNRTR